MSNTKCLLLVTVGAEDTGMSMLMFEKLTPEQERAFEDETFDLELLMSVKAALYPALNKAFDNQKPRFRLLTPEPQFTVRLMATKENLFILFPELINQEEDRFDEILATLETDDIHRRLELNYLSARGKSTFSQLDRPLVFESLSGQLEEFLKKLPYDDNLVDLLETYIGIFSYAFSEYFSRVNDVEERLESASFAPCKSIINWYFSLKKKDTEGEKFDMEFSHYNGIVTIPFTANGRQV